MDSFINQAFTHDWMVSLAEGLMAGKSQLPCPLLRAGKTGLGLDLSSGSCSATSGFAASDKPVSDFVYLAVQDGRCLGGGCRGLSGHSMQ